MVIEMSTMDDSLEKGIHEDSDERRLSAHEAITKEVYGVDIADIESGHITKSARWSLKVRSWIAKTGAEEIGIERIPTELRTDQNPRDLCTLFLSANVCTATLAFGMLGPGLFELGWWDSFLVLLFFNIIGSIPPALMATCGPKLGLRTMVLPRYSFGWWPGKVNLMESYS